MEWGLASPDQDRVLQVLLPDADATERRRIALAYQRRCLEQARQFQQAVDLPASPPPGTELYLIAGDAVPTAAVVAIDLDSGEIEIVAQGPGDGTVLRSSALMDEPSRPFSPVPITPRSPAVIPGHIGEEKTIEIVDRGTLRPAL